MAFCIQLSGLAPQSCESTERKDGQQEILPVAAVIFKTKPILNSGFAHFDSVGGMHSRDGGISQRGRAPLLGRECQAMLSLSHAVSAL